MNRQLATERHARMESVYALMHERLGGEQLAQVGRFVRQYYSGVADEDLATRNVDDLYGAALAHWRFAGRRDVGESALRLYNPQVEEHGWQSTHTVIELVVDDMPFLVDSVRMAVSRFGSTIHTIIHPVLSLQRAADGSLIDVVARGEVRNAVLQEAIMLFEIDRQSDADSLATLEEDLRRTIDEVRAAVEDWAPMRERLAIIIDDLKRNPPPIDADELEEGREFLEWLADDHFTFLGYREYELLEEDDEAVVRWGPGPGLGTRRDTALGERSVAFDSLSSDVREQAGTPRLLILTKANARARVHRPGYMDYVGIKRIDAQGVVRGEFRFIGMYTSAAYDRSLRHIPLLARRVAGVMARAGYPPRSHAGKALTHILDTYPRDVVFQASEAELHAAAMEVLHIHERARIRVLVHPDPFGRFAACIVYVPRDRFNTEVRLRIQDILAETLDGHATDFTVWLSESVLARLYFVIRLNNAHAPDVDLQALEDSLRAVTRVWTDDLFEAVHDRFGEAEGNRLYKSYGQAFRSGYRDIYPARLAVRDIEHMELLSGPGDISLSVYRHLEAAADSLSFKLFQDGAPVPLSDALPVLEDMGLRVIEERPSKIKRAGASRVYLHDFELTHNEGAHLELTAVRTNFHETFADVWAGRAESDGFNRLVLRAGLACREIIVLRAYCKFLRQTRVTYSQSYMEQALSANPEIASQLIDLFVVRFDPNIEEHDRPLRLSDIWGTIENALDAVANLDEDRILRSFLGAILATVRTNYYVTDVEGRRLPYLSLKLDSGALPELPEPRPLYETFVYSPRVEGVHLRGSRVARGGLRWSDRPEDFRTEVLGLVKAQMVKNAVIVPMGSKGGFVSKRMPEGNRDVVLAEGVACYQIFISALLDVTDNLVDGAIVPPRDVVRHDKDDPYLVVAADKGTATFSDIANEIAVSRGFWLGDAFASGGSVGYDHKGMGITARGGWESVKRHFRELGVNTQTESITVAGIGDMAGDVFGNAMLLSPHLKLVAAFNHMHIFLDPTPDVPATFDERRRLFDLPRSSWTDYDTALISEGGGVFKRSAKSIQVSPQVSETLDIKSGSMTPTDIIRAILKAPVDLLWNGGIGTYAKADAERDVDVGDRANDALRVNASELRCRVIGEGGNLGFTQSGRIQFAMLGGRVNTDAIDNSAGVDCSDHEVNIKILLDAVVSNGDMTAKQRNGVLAEMTDEVGLLVLRNNYLQTQALSLACAQASSMLDVHTRLICMLERDARLDREIEGLPDSDVIAQRRVSERGLVAPELAVLMAYAKIHLYQQLVESNFAHDDAMRTHLELYFPTLMRERFAESVASHRLRKEIVCTVVANEIVNREGMSFVFRLGEETGGAPADIARAYLVARETFAMPAFWAGVESLDNVVTATVQTHMLLEGRRLQERAARWIARHAQSPINICEVSARYGAGVEALAPTLRELLPVGRAEDIRANADELIGQGVPVELAERAALMPELFAMLDVVDVAATASEGLTEVAAVYFGLDANMELGWLRDQIIALPRDNRWEALSRAALRDDLYSLQAALTTQVLAISQADEEPSVRIRGWSAEHETAVGRYRQVMMELNAGPTPDFPMLTVILREFRVLCAPTN
jgi:glutamate dehydrogenase